MDWDFIAAIAELLGAIGVIASLVYLARQVNSSGRQARLAAVQSLQAQLNNVWTLMWSDEKAAGIFEKGSKGMDTLEQETEKLQFSAFMFSFFKPYEEILNYRNNQLVDDYTWESISNQCQALMGTPGFRDWWHNRSGWFSSVFREHISNILEDVSEYNRWQGNAPEDKQKE